MATFYVEKEDDIRKNIKCCYYSDWHLWTQLDIWAWKPILDETYVIVILFAITALFLPVALYIRHANDQVVMFEKHYHDLHGCASIEVPIENATFPGKCEVEIEIEKDMSGDLYFYYGLEKFFQTHMMYVKSRSDDQLTAEKNSELKENLKYCQPRDKGYNPSTEEDDGLTLAPCGLMAYSYFNDRFKGTIKRKSGQYVELCPNCTQDDAKWVKDKTWQMEGIAWDIDVEKFKYRELPEDMTNVTQLSNYQGLTLPRVDDEDFIVWMRPAENYRFWKLHRILKGITLYAGDKLIVDIETYFRVADFGGKKKIAISNVSRLGGRNSMLWILYLTTGCISGVCAFGFLLIFYRQVSEKELAQSQQKKK